MALLLGFVGAVGILAGCAEDAEVPDAPAAAAQNQAAPKPSAPGASSTPAGDSSDSSDAPAATPGEPDEPGDTGVVAPEKPNSIVAWYTDGLTTGTGSANDLGKLKVDANSVTATQLATLMETSKYNGAPRATDKPADFDEIFLTRAENAAFMTKMAKAVGQVRKDGYPQVIVYSNGPRCIAQAPAGSWGAIAKAGAMIGLESYTTTITADIMAANKAHPFQDTADLEQSKAANAALFAAWEARVVTYITDTKTQLGNDPALFDHITLLQYENMKHDVDTLQANAGMSEAKAQHFAALWYAAMKSAAAKEGVHWGIWHPA